MGDDHDHTSRRTHLKQGRAIRRSRSAALVTLLAFALVLTAILGWQALDAERSHRAAAESALSDYASPHCWGSAANIYRIGDEWLDTQEKIEKYAAIARRVAPAIWVRPYGPNKGFADDHLHVDIGYTRQTPRGQDAETGS